MSAAPTPTGRPTLQEVRIIAGSFAAAIVILGVVATVLYPNVA